MHINVRFWYCQSVNKLCKLQTSVSTLYKTLRHLKFGEVIVLVTVYGKKTFIEIFDPLISYSFYTACLELSSKSQDYENDHYSYFLDVKAFMKVNLTGHISNRKIRKHDKPYDLSLYKCQFTLKEGYTWDKTKWVLFMCIISLNYLHKSLDLLKLKQKITFGSTIRYGQGRLVLKYNVKGAHFYIHICACMGR